MLILSVTINSFNDEQPKNKHSERTAILFERVTLSNDLQEEKILLPIFLTLFGIVILFNFSQQEKALSSISITLSGITISVKDLHPAKA